MRKRADLVKYGGKSVQQALASGEDSILFKTFNDPTLVSMLESVRSWVMTPDKDKSLLTLSGPWEVGKTHLLNEVRRLYGKWDSSFGRKYKIRYISWPEFASTALNDRSLMSKIEDTGLVVIEDFMSQKFSRDNGYIDTAIDLAFRLLNIRVGRATIIDTNKSSSEFESIDGRIYSRLYRKGGKFISIPQNTTKFLDR